VALVPHSAEDSAEMDTNAELDEVRQQCRDDAHGALAEDYCRVSEQAAAADDFPAQATPATHDRRSTELAWLRF
jgi:hypothetical protein